LAKKNNGALELTNDAKRFFIEPTHPEISVARQCELLELPRSSYYKVVGNRESDENLHFMQLIDKMYTKYPFYGSRKMRDALRREGYTVNRKRVQRLMQKIGIQSIAPKPGTSKAHPDHKVYPYLLRNVKVLCADQVWSSDITYIPLRGGFAYLVAIIDWYSRFVLSWEVSTSMEKEFCISSLKSALRRFGRPDIFNTDQGAQFTSKAYTDILKDNDVLISMDGRGRALDNIFIERLWRSVKYEEVYTKEYQSCMDLVISLRNYFDMYNTERPHASLQGNTPAEVYFTCKAGEPLPHGTYDSLRSSGVGLTH